MKKTCVEPASSSTKIKNKKHYPQLFSNSWLQEFVGNWLQKSDVKSKSGDEMAICKVCEKTLIAHKTTLIRH